MSEPGPPVASTASRWVFVDTKLRSTCSIQQGHVTVTSGVTQVALQTLASKRNDTLPMGGGANVELSRGQIQGAQ
jgi:hypothetical protein